MRDTVLTDSQLNSHLFKAGVDVLWSAKEMHRSDDVWGRNVMEFDPDRFTEERYGRVQKQAYVPFGGGKHLCPGWNFAFAENLELMVALAVGFELDDLDEKNVRLGEAKLGEAVAKSPLDAQGGEVRDQAESRLGGC